jgi:hypothetical protein
VLGDQEQTDNGLKKVYEAFGLLRTPQIPFETAAPVNRDNGQDLHISPLQAVLAAAALSNHGTEPPPRIAISVDTPQQGWIVLPDQETATKAVEAAQADGAATAFMEAGKNYWSHIGRAAGKEGPVTWFIAGTPPNWTGTPLAAVVLLEEDNERMAQLIGQKLLTDAMSP